jgi:hypothetical protein
MASVDIDVINKFIRTNTDLWSKMPVGEEKASELILVDCLVGHPSYLMGNLIISKYLQSVYGGDIYGVIPDMENEYAVGVAKSYGVKGFIPLNQNVGEYQATARELVSPLLHLSSDKAALREAILSLSVGGIHVGDLVYDTYLRSTGKATVEELDETMLNTIHWAARYYHVCSSAFREKKVHAVVLGHVIYLRFGILARVAVSHGAQVYGRKFATNPVTVRIYREPWELYNHEYKFSYDEFLMYYGENREMAVERGRKLLEQRFQASTEAARFGLLCAYQDKNKMMTREELCSSQGLDPSKPVVVLMAHVLADCPHCTGDMIFHDYFDWLVRTVEIVRNFKHINWLVKEHPDNEHYNPEYTSLDIVRKCKGHASIGVVPADINNNALFEICDAVVSVTGTVTLEFPAMGVPAIVASDGIYSGFGFNIQARSLEEYRRLLQNAGSLPRVTDEERCRALIVAAMYFDLCRVDCCFLPEMPAEFWLARDWNQAFCDATKRLETHSIEDDELFRWLRMQIARKDAHIHRYDEMSLEGGK